MEKREPVPPLVPGKYKKGGRNPEPSTPRPPPPPAGGPPPWTGYPPNVPYALTPAAAD